MKIQQSSMGVVLVHRPVIVEVRNAGARRSVGVFDIVVLCSACDWTNNKGVDPACALQEWAEHVCGISEEVVRVSKVGMLREFKVAMAKEHGDAFQSGCKSGEVAGRLAGLGEAEKQWKEKIKISVSAAFVLAARAVCVYCAEGRELIDVSGSGGMAHKIPLTGGGSDYAKCTSLKILALTLPDVQTEVAIVERDGVTLSELQAAWERHKQANGEDITKLDAAALEYDLNDHASGKSVV